MSGAKRLMIGIIGTLLFATPALGATIELVNGATVEAVVIKETDEQVFLDLGFTVLSVPRTKIKQIHGGEFVGEAAPNVARFFGPADAPEAGEPTDRIFRTITPRERGGLETIDARKLVERYNESVVVVTSGGGWGTGFIIDARGYVMTNHHVIGGSENIRVTLLVKGDGGKVTRKEFKDVTVVAANRYLDLALLKMDEEKLKPFHIKPVILENMDTVKKGDPVFAIGNPGLGEQKLTHTVSEGIISSKARDISGLPYVQTTAAVNPGNSGGPLFNARGLVVGVVTLKAFWQEGIAFALPSTYVADFIKNREAFAYKKSQIEYLDPPKKERPGQDKPAD